MKKLKVIVWVIVLLAVCAGLGYYVYGFAKKKVEGNVHPVATLNIKNGETEGAVKIELYPEYAPNTVTNFIKLIECGYYDGKIDYGKDDICMYIGRASGDETEPATEEGAEPTKVEKGEIIDPTWSLIDPEVEKGSDADYKYSIKGEFYNNGFAQNNLSHEKGIVSLIRNDYSQFAQGATSSIIEEGYNSGNAQIGIMMSDNASSLNGLYAAFGRVIEGMDLLEKIYNTEPMETKVTETTAEATPEVAAEGDEVATTEESEDEGGIKAFAGKIVISSASVEKNGVDFGNPEIQKMFDYSTYLSNYYSQMYGGSY